MSDPVCPNCPHSASVHEWGPDKDDIGVHIVITCRDCACNYKEGV